MSYPPQPPRHKVFVSFHHDDQTYKDWFVTVMKDDIVDKSVEDGDIDDLNIKTETIRQKIRDDFIADATVTVVLIGPCTWQRKHVDWEIGSSLRKTDKNPRCGLLGILLPNHPDFEKQTYSPRLIPPRLADNCGGDDPFACIYDWPGPQKISAMDLEFLKYSSVSDEIRRFEDKIRNWIHRAFERRDKMPPPDNSRDQFRRNRPGSCSAGWKD